MTTTSIRSATTGPICMNRERARRLMAQDGIDVLLASGKYNVAYLSGFVWHHWVWDGIQHLMERNWARDEDWPLAGFFIDPAEPPFLAADEWVTQFNYLYPDLETVWDQADRKVFHDNRFSFPALRATVRALRERGMEAARIGYEDTRLPAYYLRWLREQLPKATFVPADDLFWRIRAVKTPEEIRRMREAFRIATAIYHETFDMMKPGVMLGDIEKMQVSRARDLGGLWFVNHLWVHEPGSHWRPPPEYRIQRGDEGGCDLVIYYQGYNTDFARTVSVGPVARETQWEYDTLVAAYDAMKQVCNPAHCPADLCDAAARVAKEIRGGRPAFCIGHGLGLEVHELPAIIPTEREPFEPGMVVQIEVGSVEPPRNSFLFLEDAGVVTENGWERLNDLPQEIRIVG